ncbi:MAG: type IX secretion system membrane protein PorP/SprF [Cyclobacteriaceae bacterium]|nr:type IX secretion system membrane protein PorP/SprF [Cyclobacteriaceae bacterium]
MMRFLLVMLFVGSGLTLVGQDPQFSQYYQAPLYLNPGFTGITPQQRVVFNHRVQWPNLPQAFSTFAASYDIFVDELRSGFGILATTDRMGSAGWRTTTVGLLYSYKVKLSEKIVFSPGLYFGYGTNGLDRTKLRLGDGLQYERPGQPYSSADFDQFKISQQSYFDFGAGFLFYSRVWWLGASFQHMNEPNLSILNDVSRLPMKTAIHGGVKIPLHGTSMRRSTSSPDYLTPSAIFRMQGPSFSQFDLGVNYHIDPVSVGLWYRGKPWSKTVINSPYQDALVLTLGLYFKNLNIGYSYDFTVSELQTSTGGSHEISVVYEFVSRPARRNVKKKYKLIPCPTFNSKEGFWN